MLWTPVWRHAWLTRLQDRPVRPAAMICSSLWSGNLQLLRHREQHLQPEGFKAWKGSHNLVLREPD